MNPTVSIIVPVYNAENYLERCIESVLRQEYTDFEVLLVDDGSTDASGEICDRYAALDGRIRAIHKENTGVSETRNLALREAKGTYLQFLDSDDWITADATKLLVRAATEHHCDLVITDFYRVVGERVSRKGDIEENRVLTKAEFAERMMENPADFYYGVLWNKLYRRELVEKYGLSMDSRISWCEDFMFNLEYLMHAETVFALQVPIYYYVKRKGSLVSQSSSITKSIRMKMTVFEYYNNFYKNVYDEKDYEKKRLQVYSFLIDVAGDGAVPFSIVPGVKKLGNERTNVNAEILDGDGIFLDIYRQRKLLEQYLEVAALKHGLELKDVILLLYLKQVPDVKSRKELADFMGIPVRSVSHILQKLASKEILKVTEIHSRKAGEPRLQVDLLPGTEGLMRDLETAERDFEEARFAGFDEIEREQYGFLYGKMKENILRVLK
ncbi:MAG: glycosyltransferase [Eubacteriales bacterium]|nr:glycosyltransferase [Eubacteriales bacterium]